ncbi:4897_t:CDS:2, partial [Acaulospora morrowiae]
SESEDDLSGVTKNDAGIFYQRVEGQSFPGPNNAIMNFLPSKEKEKDKYTTYKIQDNVPQLNSFRNGYNEIYSLNLRINNSQDDNEIFVIEIPKEKKVDMLKPIVKKRLSPLFDYIPSTKIKLCMNHPQGERSMQPTIEISKYFQRAPDPDNIHIFVYPPTH